MNKIVFLLFFILAVACNNGENEFALNPVFPLDSLKLCKLTVPKGYPQSQTHAGIVYVKDSLCGYQYWLSSSPYPNVTQGKGDAYENPLIYFANSEKGTDEPPTDFIPYDKNPIVDRPIAYNNSSSYNSDPDLFLKDSVLYLLNRTYQVDCPIYKGATHVYDKLAVCIMQAVTENDTLLGFTRPKEILNSDALNHSDNPGVPTFISPSLTYKDGLYRLFYLITNTYNDGKSCRKLIMMSTPNINVPFLCKNEIFMLKGDVEPWHMSVFNYKDKLYAIICCTYKGRKQICYQYLAEFDKNLSSIVIYQRPLISIPSYRGSAFVREDGMFILYSSVIYKGLNSNSVDGRDIVMAKMPFDRLLKEVMK